MVTRAYKKIKRVGALPSPAGVARDILRLANDDSTTIHEIVAVVQRDPASAPADITLAFPGGMQDYITAPRRARKFAYLNMLSLSLTHCRRLTCYEKKIWIYRKRIERKRG